jgi:GAF domain-containing protein
MKRRPLSILLISTDDLFVQEITEMMQVPVPAVDVAFVLEVAASTSSAQVTSTGSVKVGSPEVILLDAGGEDEITAVSHQFPQTPILLLTDHHDKKIQRTAVTDVLLREHLSAPLLKRVLAHSVQASHYAYIQEKGREHRLIAEALLQAGVNMNATLDYETLLDNILEYVADFFPYDLATIMQRAGDFIQIERVRTANIDESLEWLIHKATHTVFPLAETQSLRQIMENGRYFVVPNVEDYSGWQQISEAFCIRSWVGAPLIVQGEVFGIITMESLQPDVYHDEDGALLTSFATQAALALRNARIYQERQREIAELSALHAISQASTEAVTVDDLLTHCTLIVVDKLYPDSFGFILINDDGATMSAHHALHNRLPVIHPEKLPVGTGIVGQVIQTGKLRRISDVRSEQSYEDIVVHTHSELCVPLKVGGQIIGAINAESILFDAFTEADERFLVTLSQQLATAIERIQLLEAERRSQEEADKLREAAAFLTTSLDLQQVFNHILSGLEDVVEYDNALVMLLYEGELMIAATRGVQALQSLVGHHFHVVDLLFEEIQQIKRPLCLADAQKDPRFIKTESNKHIRSWVGFPLIVRDQVLGALTIDNKQVGVYGETEMQLAQSFANQAAIAIDNARLYTAEQKAREQAEIMREANAMMVQTLDMDTILKTLLDYLHRLVSFDSASILFVEGDFAYIHLTKGAENWTDIEALKQIRIHVNTNGTFQEIINSGRGLLIPDVHKDSRWETFETSRYVRSWIGVPMIAGGEFLGCFSIDKAMPDYFSKGHLELIESFTSQAAILVQNAQLFQETQRRAVELERITALSAALRETTELERLLDIILKNMLQLANSTFGGIYLLDTERGDLVLRATMPVMPNLLGIRQPIGQGIVGFVAKTGKPYVVRDLKTDPLLEAGPEEEILLTTLRSGINLPLWVGERVVGVLYVGLDRAHVFSEAEIKLLTAVSEIAGTAIDRAIVLNTLEQRIALRTQELGQANERLTELDRLKTKFVSDVSHELRTPITNLSLYLDLLIRGKPERRDQYAAVLRQQVDRLTNIIEDILNISRLDMGKIKLSILLLDVNRVIQQVVGQFEAQIDENVVLLTEFHQEIPFILGDEQLIIQILTNLLTNAVAYTQHGSICIGTFWDDIQKQACIEIKDTGMGIPPQELGHVFERFYRASNVSQSTMVGTGLGLSLVKELIELHHGEISIESEINTGTTVTLYLPISPRLSAVA